LAIETHPLRCAPDDFRSLVTNVDLEEPADLIADLSQALNNMDAPA
jgi:hypothetical protein